MPGPITFASIAREWQEDLLLHKEENKHDTPNYYASTPSTLTTSSTVHNFITGTGDNIFSSILPALESAESEIIFITCFWARSSSLSQLANTLRALSIKAQARGGWKLRVRIGLSSLSLFQKIFQPHTITGQTYTPSTWVKTLGLPSPAELGGLDLEIKSVFLLPFSVMHPKFIIVDRKRVFLPSCNVSWESWFEGCIELSGLVVSQFVRFWLEFWSSNEHERSLPPPPSPPHPSVTSLPSPQSPTPIHPSPLGPAHTHTPLPTHSIPTLFLPSPHHLNPRFAPFSSSPPLSPPTPLNTLLLTLLARANSSIYIQTPNLTAPPVLTALLRALRRGVAVHIRTSARLMILEQLVTAGTTTTRCVRKLVRRHRALLSSATAARDEDEEAGVGLVAPGALRVEFFEPLGGFRKEGMEGGEPQQSHLKLLIVDEAATVLGSGNLDRASWYTSQELGVAFFDGGVAGAVRGGVEGVIGGRVRGYYG
ncbi:uncharacterized protein BDZ99DRAFT_383036 [Mytilinidion resinicola]|uniref:PLD phosphodiesterase domain-containing protein n=1 Tax=Mytilinidion resinicola TaxID=574789 RepID=A0A6A6YTJ7_9PEZI|nr:uncharacterized protein BDZ99DRAFT_383036 [Mytilinidion resinicola]KAF2812130.1 hypothetical protein BDZ99DRAFT_383036 [Mytilinidion resinicola]